jgi:hypothetical protein
MAWTDSRIFREWPNMVFQVSGTGYTGLDSDTVKVALFKSSAVPDRDAAVGSTGYNTGTWTAAGNEATGASEWVAGGRALTAKTFTTPSSGVFRFTDTANLPGSASITIADAAGMLVYDDTISGGSVAKQGVCFNFFGSTLSVAAGTFGVVFGTNGILQITA